MKHPAYITRRRFLAGFGASLLAVPWVSGLATRMLHAAEGIEPTRFVMVFTGNNQLPHHWIPPSGGTSDFTLAPALEPLQAFRDQMQLVHGLQGVNGHSGGMSETTTGRPSTNGNGVATGGPSIDQYLASLWREHTPLPSLETGVFPGNNPNDQICYASSGLPIPAIGAPMGAFNKLFSVTNEDPEVAQRQRRGEASVLDLFAKDLTAAQQRLSQDARVLLDEHLTLIREREQELARPYEPQMCPIHEAPTGVGKHIERVWVAQNATIAAALRCGSTRVASLRVGGWGGTGGYREVGLENAHHHVAHGGSGDPDGDLLAINRWHAQQVADLATRLAEQPTMTGGTLLDHTVLVWFNELGLGGINNHGRRDVPVVMLGGSQAGFKTGNYHRFDSINYQHYLYTLARVLGEPTMTRFGDDGTQLLTELLV